MLSLKYLQTEDATSRFQNELEVLLRRKASICASHTMTFRPGNYEGEALFFAEQGFWAIVTDGRNRKAKNRYWNCFGVGGDPKIASSMISVEVNHPYAGINRSVGGRFLEGDDGTRFIAHTGRLGGGVSGLTIQGLIAYSGRAGFEVIIENKIEVLPFLWQLDDSEGLVKSLGEYVHLTQRFRDHVKSLT